MPILTSTVSDWFHTTILHHQIVTCDPKNTMAAANARAVSLAVLLLACAPLTSLYAAFSPGLLLYLPPNLFIPSNKVAQTSINDKKKGSVPASESASSLHAILQDPNLTLEEFWAALFRETQDSHVVLASSLLTVRVHHFSILLPWFISLLLGVILPFMLSILSLMNYLRADDTLEEDDEDEYPWVSRCNRGRYEKRMKKLIAKIQDYRKVCENK